MPLKDARVLQYEILHSSWKKLHCSLFHMTSLKTVPFINKIQTKSTLFTFYSGIFLWSILWPVTNTIISYIFHWHRSCNFSSSLVLVLHLVKAFQVSSSQKTLVHLQYYFRISSMTFYCFLFQDGTESMHLQHRDLNIRLFEYKTRIDPKFSMPHWLHIWANYIHPLALVAYIVFLHQGEWKQWNITLHCYHHCLAYTFVKLLYGNELQVWHFYQYHSQ